MTVTEGQYNCNNMGYIVRFRDEEGKREMELPMPTKLFHGKSYIHTYIIVCLFLNRPICYRTSIISYANSIEGL